MQLFTIKDEIAFEIFPSDDHFIEKDIEDFVKNNPNVLLNERILIFGRQVHTASGKILDLLALDKYGRIIVIELKRGLAPRDMMAQILDYSSWIKKLSERELEKIAKDYFAKNNLPYKSIHTAFEEFFKVKNAPTIGSELVNVLFAQDYPEDLMNAVSYLADSGIPIYLLKFNWFKDQAGAKFILIEKLIGEDEDEEEIPKNDKAVTTKNIGEKQPIRQLFNNVKKYLENNHLDWATQFDAEWQGFKIYQTRSGDWISIRGEWNTKDGFYQLLFGLELSKNKKVLVSRIALPKHISTDNIDGLAAALNNNKYYEKPPRVLNRFWKNQVTYVKTLQEGDDNSNLDSNEELLFEYVKKETPVMMEFINKLLPKK